MGDVVRGGRVLDCGIGVALGARVMEAPLDRSLSVGGASVDVVVGVDTLFMIASAPEVIIFL